MIIKESVLKRIIRNILLEGGGDSSIYVNDKDLEGMPYGGAYLDNFEELKNSKRAGKVKIGSDDTEERVITTEPFKIKKNKSILIQNVVKVLEKLSEEHADIFNKQGTIGHATVIAMLNEKQFISLTKMQDTNEVKKFMIDFLENSADEYTNLNYTQYKNSALEILLTNWDQFAKYISKTQELNNQILNKVVSIVVKIKQKYRAGKEKFSVLDDKGNIPSDLDYLTAKEAKAKNPSHKVSGY